MCAMCRNEMSAEMRHAPMCAMRRGEAKCLPTSTQPDVSRAIARGRGQPGRVQRSAGARRTVTSTVRHGSARIIGTKSRNVSAPCGQPNPESGQ